MKKAYFVNGKKISGVEDLPVGETLVRVCEVNEELPKKPMTIIGTWSETAINAMVMGLLEAGMKIHAIKLVRAATGWGFSTAKQYVDNLQASKRYLVDRLIDDEWGNTSLMTLDDAIQYFTDTNTSISIKGYCLWSDVTFPHLRAYGVTYEGGYVVAHTTLEKATNVFRDAVR